jgi:hypothetical protein
MTLLVKDAWLCPILVRRGLSGLDGPLAHVIGLDAKRSDESSEPVLMTRGPGCCLRGNTLTKLTQDASMTSNVAQDEV